MADIIPPSAARTGEVAPSRQETFVPKVEEDDSETSSPVIELFDRESGAPLSRKRNLGHGLDEAWQRYRSSESATSTLVSSICSSAAVDDKSEKVEALRLQFSRRSKKRLSDGSLKPISTRQSSESVLHTESASHDASFRDQECQPLVAASATPAMPKRRGRPPGQKSHDWTMQPTSLHYARRASQISQLQAEVRPRSSIPSRLPASVFASQCIEAAHAARLSPYTLHPGEHELLVDLVMAREVTVYLNIRNAILRLWHYNPLCSVTAHEAAGCAKEGRFYGLAEVAYKWLVRNGYINFGCVEVPSDKVAFRQSRKTASQKTVIVIGSGVSGLTAARQLEGLFAQNADQWTDAGQRPPRVIVLEGRRRLGGRVYSQPLRTQVPGSLPDDLRNTAEMGAMIVTGFEHGNPLNTIVRGQLGLRYHLMKDALTIYDCNGQPVDEARDMLTTELYTDISDRAGAFRAAPQKPYTLSGEEDLINRFRDPVSDGFEQPQFEASDDIEDPRSFKPASRRGRRRNAPPGTEKLTGRTRVLEDSNATESAARAAKSMGWDLLDGVSKNHSVSLEEMATASACPTLGSVMDDAMVQYQDIIPITPQDMRLLNWHHANLEYANAAPVSWLSLSGHDQDTGNEFEGAHSEIIGGYTQLPRALMHLPTPLDVRFERIVDSIHYHAEWDDTNERRSKVVCTNGETFEADEVIVTVPLGVLKSGMIDFDPPLPLWKRGAIDRMGFGLLNKVILLYDKPFWDDSRDMFGLLNSAECDDSLDPRDYERRRGRFFLIWNASKISGRPMLVALLAGHAAHDAEVTDSSTLLGEINGRLCSVFGASVVPAPLEAIVTRWKRDPFTRGTYSYVAPETMPGDYDLMARGVGNVHFAGEATCGTHPATVHGAFLSGLRAAADVMNAMAGPITLPIPLVGPFARAEAEQSSAPSTFAHSSSYEQPKQRGGSSWGSITLPINFTSTQSSQATGPLSAGAHEAEGAPANAHRTAGRRAYGPPRNSVCAADASFWAQASTSTIKLEHEAGVMSAILAQLGERPPKPARPGVNPFLLYTKEKWEECKSACALEPAGNGTASRDAIRATLGRWWRALPEAAKQPYLKRSQLAQEQADAGRRAWDAEVAKWDAEAQRIRAEYASERDMLVERPGSSGGGGSSNSNSSRQAGDGADGDTVGVSRRRTNTSNCIVLDGI